MRSIGPGESVYERIYLTNITSALHQLGFFTPSFKQAPVKHHLTEATTAPGLSLVMDT